MTKSTDTPPGDDSEIAKMNVYQKMAVAQNIFRYLQKPHVDGLHYHPVLHDPVAREARAALLSARLYAEPTVEEHGQEGNRTWARVRTDYVNIDNPEDRFSVTMFGYGNDKQDKGPGMAITYACKYCHLKAFGVECGKDAESELPGNSEETDLPANEKYGTNADRADLYESIKLKIEKHELDPEYVKERLKPNGKKPTWEQLSEMEKHIGEHPELWREPKKETASVQA